MAFTIPEPGLIVLFGSGETSPTGRKVFERIFHALPDKPKLALLETPAGFELNSPKVIGRVGDFFTRRLQNFSPQVDIIPARKRGTFYSPDRAEIVAPILSADLIFMGPGSPSYAVRQLRDSMAWYTLVARHRLGACLALASSAAIAAGAWALPVYEIYKVGEDLFWNKGLDLFGYYGLPIIFIPHWNNQEGGMDLDTSRCFMGCERFIKLIDMLPDNMTVIGLDEKTALIINPRTCECSVRGLGGITILHREHKHNAQYQFPLYGKTTGAGAVDNNLFEYMLDHKGHIHVYQDGQGFSLHELGPYRLFDPDSVIPRTIWHEALRIANPGEYSSDTPPDEILSLVELRQQARRAGNWNYADELRQQIEAKGWQVMDTKTGPVSKKIMQEQGKP